MSVASWYPKCCCFPVGTAQTRADPRVRNRLFYAQGPRGPFQEIMMISCPAGSDCFQSWKPLALCQNELGPLHQRGDWPTRLPVPGLSWEVTRRGINEEQGELYWRSLLCVLWVWPFRDKAQLSWLSREIWDESSPFIWWKTKPGVNAVGHTFP